MNSALTQKIVITFGFLFAYRVLAYIPVPGVDTAVIASFFDSNSGGMLGMANMFSGKWQLGRNGVLSLLGIYAHIITRFNR